MMKGKKILAVLFVMLLALSRILAVSATVEYDDDDEQDIYWEESGRAYLFDTLYAGSGRTFSETERRAFFSTYAVTMTRIAGGAQYSGFFALNADGSYSGRFAASWSDGTTTASDFYGMFNEVIQLNMYTYALRTEQIYWTREEEPEVMQETMLFTIPGERNDLPGAMSYEIRQIAEENGTDPAGPLDCAFITAFDSAPLWYSEVNSGSAITEMPEPVPAVSEIYGLTIDKLATRKGPGTQYEGGGTYSVKGKYIRVLTRAYDKRNGIWWVKCEIPYRNEIRVLWTGYKRFNASQLPLESIPLDPEY